MTTIEFKDKDTYYKAFDWCYKNLRSRDWNWGYKGWSIVFLDDKAAVIVSLRFQ